MEKDFMIFDQVAVTLKSVFPELTAP